MTVYVDTMRASFKNMSMCHMIADTNEELHAMAQAIGLKKQWFQGDHYDISLGKRKAAIAAGAREITYRQCGAMTYFRRLGVAMPDPENAEKALIDHFSRSQEQQNRA